MTDTPETPAERLDHERNRRLAFCTKFAYPATDRDSGRQCLTCKDGDSPLWRTYFEGSSIPAFMCALCIQASYDRVTQFIEQEYGVRANREGSEDFKAGLEKAARVCDRIDGYAAEDCASAIRKLITPATPSELPSEYICIDEAQAVQVFDYLNGADLTVDPDMVKTHLNLCLSCQEGAVALKHITPATLSEDGWMPIESAPKDGQHILGWNKGWKTPHEMWWVALHKTWSYGSILLPTHWMPLPLVPKPEK